MPLKEESGTFSHTWSGWGGDSQLVSCQVYRESGGMNPLVFIIPVLIATSGVVCFFVLPMPLNVRLAIMVADLVAAGVVALVLYRRFGR